MAMKAKILCLPGGMPRSLEYLRSVDQGAVEVIGASSEKYDVSRKSYQQWYYIPHITHPDFAQSLIELVKRQQISQLFTPHQVIWNFVQELVLENGLELTLVNTQPIETELQPYQEYFESGQELFESTLPLAAASSGKKKLLPIQYASLFRHAQTIPGETDGSKIAALCEVMRYCPPGDIIEIGVLWGKSAFVLAYLAKNYSIGPILCIDPWNRNYLPQGSELLMKYSSNTHDISSALSIFQMNLLPYGCGNINYRQSPSNEAFRDYCSNFFVKSQAFGLTIYSGSVALLHIDGNHAYEFVRQDLALWQKKVCPGGWVVLDDYCWMFGNGPQKAGDSFILNNRERIQCAFVMGGALFFQFRI